MISKFDLFLTALDTLSRLAQRLVLSVLDFPLNHTCAMTATIGDYQGLEQFSFRVRLMLIKLPGSSVLMLLWPFSIARLARFRAHVRPERKI